MKPAASLMSTLNAHFRNVNLRPEQTDAKMCPSLMRGVP